MKSMNEIINSIKDEKLRRFAIGLKEKLEVAKNAITRKKKNGGEVTGAEKSALQTSTSNYVKKNRGNVPQKVAGALAALMLVSMLSSCDELLEGLVNGTVIEDAAENQPGEDAETAGDDGPIVVPDEEGGFNNEVYKTLVVENFDSKPVDPHNCGTIGVLLTQLNYGEMFRDSSASKIMLSDYNEVMGIYSTKREDYEENIFGKFDPFMCCALSKISNANKRRSNFSIDFEDDGSGWRHKLVSTDYNFALVSKDEKGNIFLTGFVNGRLENDLGFIDKDAIKLITEISKKYTYNNIVNATRQEAFARLYARHRNSVEGFAISASYTFEDENGDMMHASAWRCELKTFMTINMTGGPDVIGKFNYEVAEDYFDKLLESGKVIDGTLMVNPDTQDYYIPGYIQKDDNTADNDPNAGEDDGAERDPNAGEPEMGEDDETVGGKPGHLEDEEANEG